MTTDRFAIPLQERTAPPLWLRSIYFVVFVVGLLIVLPIIFLAVLLHTIRHGGL